MSSADRAAELRAQADALDAVVGLEHRLLDAKASGDPAAIDDAAKELRNARQQIRTEGVSIGGDAFISNPEEG